MMLVTALIKALHVTAAISVLGSIFLGCLFLKPNTVLGPINKKLDRFSLIALALAVLGGTALVPLRHYTFTTPWIDAAYLLVFLVALGLHFTNRLKYKIRTAPEQSSHYRSLLLGTQLLMIILIFLIIHDAIFKSTYL